MMKNNRNTIAGIILLFCAIANMVSAQEALLSSGGTSTDGSVSYSFGLFAYSTYFDGSSSVAQGVQHPWESFIEGTVLPNFHLSKVSINHSTCYNALQNITVAGDGEQVDIESTAFVEFIAGQSIRFLPGFHAQSGSTVHAHITTTGTFCDPSPAPSIVQAKPTIEKSIEFETDDAARQAPFGEKQIKLYPNPNRGSFTVELNCFTKPVDLYLYNLTGVLIYREMRVEQNNVHVDLPFLKGGIYTLRASDGLNTKTVKMVIH